MHNVELPRFRGLLPRWGIMEDTMPKSHRPYPPEYRERMLELVRAGRSPRSLAREFEPSEQCIRNWIQQADRDAGRRTDGLTTDERTELQRLRRENATLREEREILKKAAAWFARETGSIPSKDSDS
jgi:transposase